MTASDPPPPSDVCLLLRAHAEQHWLSREVEPVLHELEDRDSIPSEQLTAALAYLEVLWIEAARRALETDAAYNELAAADGGGDLQGKARGYHAVVRTLRDSVADHVTELITSPAEALSPDAVAEVLEYEQRRRGSDRIRSGSWRPRSTSSRIPPTQTAL